ncbi:antitoxin [uncultured Tessaracoccus sp.]|uniref:antitoxin n=1 Tax=uncultured Tessaracoccus sp. TaxID=905023 RepID=UPI00262C7ECB|nr:antitoxin [uncultured Tessaracoccus sp.]
MGMFDDIKNKVAGQDPDKLREGVEKAGDFVDEKTDSKYADKVDKAQDFANDQLDKLGGKNDNK